MNASTGSSTPITARLPAAVLAPSLLPPPPPNPLLLLLPNARLPPQSPFLLKRSARRRKPNIPSLPQPLRPLRISLERKLWLSRPPPASIQSRVKPSASPCPAQTLTQFWAIR